MNRTRTFGSALALVAAAHAGAQEAPLQAGFPTTLVAPGINTSDSQVRISSPTLADLTGDGRPEIVFGTPDGVVWAIRSSGGVLWAFDSGDAPIESTPAIADVDLDGSPDVVVGAGSTLQRPSAFGLRQENAGTLVVLRGDTGALKCRFTPKDHPGTPAGPEGIYSSPALADLDRDDGGLLEIAVGSWDFHIYALNHDCTVKWEKDEPDRVIDTTWSSPAIADLDRDGMLDVIIGTDSHVEPQTPDTGDGGMVHAFRGDGSGSLPGFPKHLDEVIYASPSIGDVNGDGQLDIVVGTGNCWERVNCAPPRPNHPVNERVFGFDRQGNNLPGWPFDLPDTEYVVGTVALVDIDGNPGTLEAVFNTLPKDTLGNDFTTPNKVYVVNANGTTRAGWPRQTATPANCVGATQSPASRGSPVVGNVTGDARLEVVIGSGADVVIFDRDGNQLTRSNNCTALTLKTNEPATIDSSPALGDLDGDGDVEIIAGAWRVTSGTDPLRGTIHAWDMTGAVSTGSLPWPMFRRTANGNARVESTLILFADGFE